MMSKTATKRKYFNSDEVPESEATIAAKQEIQKALSSMLDDIVVERKPSVGHVTQTGHVTTEDECSIELFSAKTRENYSKLAVSVPVEAPKRKQSSRPMKKKTQKSRGNESDSSSEEEDLELLASVAVSANDLGTSNSQLNGGAKVS